MPHQKRIFDKNLDLLYSISKMWQGIPIIIVLTKSYSSAEINNNIKANRVSTFSI